MVEAFALFVGPPIAAWLGGRTLLEASVVEVLGEETVAALLCTDSERESDQLLDRSNSLLPCNEAIEPEANAEVFPLTLILSRCLG